jgi:hypothetical protein
LKKGTNDESGMNENARGHLSTEGGGWKNEGGEDDPYSDGDEQEGTLGD